MRAVGARLDRLGERTKRNLKIPRRRRPPPRSLSRRTPLLTAEDAEDAEDTPRGVTETSRCGRDPD